MSAASNDEFIELYEGSIVCLLDKFNEEIVDLEAAVKEEHDDLALRQQLGEALKQTIQLRDELHVVLAMYRDALAKDRMFTIEESQALRYFGFDVPSDLRPPKGRPSLAVVPLTTAATTTSRTTNAASNNKTLAASTSGAPSAMVGWGSPAPKVSLWSVDPREEEGGVEDTETDVQAARRCRASVLREPSPEWEDQPVMTPPSPTVRHSPSQQQPQVASKRSPQSDPTALSQSKQNPHYHFHPQQQQTSPSTSSATGPSNVDRHHISSSSGGSGEDAATKRMITALQDEILRIKHERVEERSDHLSELDAVRREWSDRLVAAEQAQSQQLRLLEQSLEDRLQRYEKDLLQLQDRLAEAQQGKQNALQRCQQLLDANAQTVQATEASMKRLSDVLEQSTKTETDRLLRQAHQQLEQLVVQQQEQWGSLAESLSRWRSDPHNRRLSVDATDGGATTTMVPFSAMDDALRCLCLIDEQTAPIQYVVGSGGAEDEGEDNGPVAPIDAAVVALLNRMQLPCSIPLRRLGPDGDYFLDQRVQLRLVNGHVVVRPRPLLGAQGEPFEHFAQYLVKLFGPLLDRTASSMQDLQQQDEGLPPPPATTTLSTAGGSSSILSSEELRAEKARLQEMLRREEATLMGSDRTAPTANTNRIPPPHPMVAMTTSRAKRMEAEHDEEEYRRPPSPSPMPVRDEQHTTDWGSQSEPPTQQIYRSGAGRAAAAVVAPAPSQSRPRTTERSVSSGGGGSSHSAVELSHLSNEELERLKRLALAQQHRQMKERNAATATRR